MPLIAHASFDGITCANCSLFCVVLLWCVCHTDQRGNFSVNPRIQPCAVNNVNERTHLGLDEFVLEDFGLLSLVGFYTADEDRLGARHLLHQHTQRVLQQIDPALVRSTRGNGPSKNHKLHTSRPFLQLERFGIPGSVFASDVVSKRSEAKEMQRRERMPLTLN